LLSGIIVSAPVTLFTRVIEVRQRVLGPKKPDTLEAIAHLGELRIDQARYTEAEAMLRGCLDIQRQTMPSDYRRYLTEPCWAPALPGTTNTWKPNRSWSADTKA
jgi:tetratricopeptide repeat protein